jgi:DNA-directed RNA polymerase subunit alpha
MNNFLVKLENKKSESEATFSIGPLPRGYGDTFGVVLRRVLLSSIPGAAITGIKIDGIMHEFSTVSGVSDDVLRIILSLKGIVVRLKSLEKQTIEIEVKGKDGESVPVRAADFEQNTSVEILNPDYIITHITGSKNKFKAKLTIERGIGYKQTTVEERTEIGYIPIDANFSPVKLVTYNVSKTRVGQDSSYDQLNITIKTNGSVTPLEALYISVDTLKEMFVYFDSVSKTLTSGQEIAIKLNEESKQYQYNQAVDKKQDNSLLKIGKRKSDKESSILIKDLDLSTRLTNALTKAGFSDLYQFEGMTEEEIANIKGLGAKSFDELMDVLKQYSIKVI